MNLQESALELLFGKKGEEVCQKIISFHQRFPKLFPKALLRGLKRYLLSCTEAFLENHSTSSLRRIFLVHNNLIKETQKDPNQKIHIKVLEIDSSTYGIAIALYPLKEDEIFGERQILKGVQNLIPGIKPIPDSFLAFETHNVHLFYLEIKKMRGGRLSKKKLNTQLHIELSQGIECLSHSLFLPGNEEETFKNIRHLSQEISSSYDLPQAMITLVEYFSGTLKFLVIVLRVVKPKTPSLESLSSRLPSMLHFSVESILHVGKLDKRYPKEASVFTLEVNSKLFSREHSAVNLRTARQYISKVLEGMLGPFRDYNGGLLIKENEQLFAIKRGLDKRGVLFPQLEDLFYGIKPIAIRVLTSTKTGIELATLFQQIERKPLDHDQHYCHAFHKTKEVHIAIIKTSEKEWKNSFPQRILSYSSQFGYSSLDHEGYLYLCFFHQYPTESTLFDALQSTLNETFLSLPREESILHINFQGGNPSSFNPHLATDIHCHTLCNFLFEGLMRMDCSGEIVPATATKIDVSPCGTKYTFHLRRSYWSNGEEVTAYHFERAWKKALMASWISRDFFAPIKNAIEVRKKLLPIDQAGIIVKDAKTLCVELNAPCSYFLNLMATPQFYPLFGEAEEPSNFNGPFTLAEWKRNELIYLSQNPFYWDAKNLKLGGIKISMISDPLIAYTMFQKGELDVIGDPSSPLPPKILKRRDVQNRLIYKPISRIFWIHCNTHAWPLNNAYLRRALSLALNRKRLTEEVFINQIPHCSPLPPKYASHDGNIEGDSKLAQKYFNLALKELEIDRNDFPPIEIIHSDLSFEKPLMEELKAQWKEVLGISLQPKLLQQWSEFSSSLEKGEFQLGGLFRRDLYNDPSFYMSFFATSSSNPHSLENEEYQTLLDRFHREEYQEEAFREIEHLLIEEAPVIPLVNQRYLVLVNPRIKGVDWSENGCLDIKEITFDEKYTHSTYSRPNHCGVSEEGELDLSKEQEDINTELARR